MTRSLIFPHSSSPQCVGLHAALAPSLPLDQERAIYHQTHCPGYCPPRYCCSTPWLRRNSCYSCSLHGLLAPGRVCQNKLSDYSTRCHLHYVRKLHWLPWWTPFHQKTPHKYVLQGSPAFPELMRRKRKIIKLLQKSYTISPPVTAERAVTWMPLERGS